VPDLPETDRAPNAGATPVPARRELRFPFWTQARPTLWSFAPAGAASILTLWVALTLTLGDSSGDSDSDALMYPLAWFAFHCLLVAACLRGSLLYLLRRRAERGTAYYRVAFVSVLITGLYLAVLTGVLIWFLSGLRDNLEIPAQQVSVIESLIGSGS